MATLYNIPKSVLNDVKTSLRMSKGVQLPDDLQPCDSVQWAVENERDLSGFADMHALGVAQDGTIYIRTDTLVLEDEPEEFPVKIEIRDGKLYVTFHYGQVENLNIVRDAKDDKRLLEVAEVTLTE